MNRSIQLIYYLGFLFAFSYIIVRGFTVGITHDEALTYKIIQGDEILKGTANHHWLNTQLSTLSTQLFGFKEFALRLPNILSFGVFWFFLFRISINFLKSSAAQLTLLLLLCGNPFILDFFSLCRGYGLSIAFVTASLFYLFKIAALKKDSKPIHSLLGTCFSILALSANLNTLNYFLVAQTLILLSLVVYRPKRYLLTLSLVILFSGIPLYFSLDHLFFLKDHDELYFGTENIQTTIDGLICSGFYSINGFKNVEILRYLLYALLLFAGFLMIRKKQLFTPGSYAFITMISIFVALITEHFLFDSLYPINRSSLYLYPIILLAFLLNIDELKWKVVRISLYTSSVLFLLCSLLAFNFERTMTWAEDQHVKEVMLLIKNNIKDDSIHTAECTWIYEPMINYYRVEYQVPIQQVFRDGIKCEAEYLLIHPSENLSSPPDKKIYRILLCHIRECGLCLYWKAPVIATN